MPSAGTNQFQQLMSARIAEVTGPRILSESLNWGSMRRREFIKFIGSFAAAYPLTAHSQQPDRMRRIGILVSLAEDDPEGQAA
jgi:hypothetical protein